tara:strand:+ start:607 stop:1176 length:570 start_codon:yes stop_codon:yes gene_type:complete
MKDYVDSSDKSLVATRGFDDSLERRAVHTMLFNSIKNGGCKVFKSFIFDYFNLEGDNFHERYELVSDPLGKKKVDMGIVEKDTRDVIGLIEVDVYNKWVNFNFPSNYTKLNRLRRKENYYKNNNLKYINISFSANHKSGIFSTREMEEKYREETWYVPELDKWDVGKRLRLEHTTMIGEVVKNIATLPV